ncbi:hypothetical protein P170DRAFT_476029 [Aspergillus steynii IBT 23096]|uniref:Fungal-type protein kinase domain-containing protein n=1 Tax=Aspergillus steynii IBT 23096 TaxID=1392250 RepID=A0A2I2GA34_9EURO|nr:uncharacterized protein P170DRAFT_476029 [Aspergillus steynii IBT 23096]PLB49742.1 hypothetical protein P170DRAFT_476029 [Aspergillus steynii IBT 23096]
MAPRLPWFDELTKTLKALAKRLPKNDGKDLHDALELATKQSQEDGLPSQTVTAMDLGEMDTIFVTSLADYNLVVKGSPKNEALARIKIDLLFIAALAARKRAHPGASEPRESFESLREYRSLHMQVETRVHILWKYKGKLTDVTGKMDYSLWYGEDPTCQESNLVVVAAKSYAHNGFYQAICYMDTTIWGIATDGKEWKFIRLDADSTINFSVCFMHKGESSNVFGMICLMVHHAASLVTMAVAPESTR